MEIMENMEKQIVERFVQIPCLPSIPRASMIQICPVIQIPRFIVYPLTMPNQHSRMGYDFGEITDRILKCAVEVHRELGPYYLETAYQVALAFELQSEGLEFERECWMDVYYKGHKVDKRRIDFIVEDILLEIKAKQRLEDVDRMQTLSYLKTTGMKIGLLINFGAPKIEVKRIQWTPEN